MNYIQNLPNYVRNGIAVLSLCGILVGCSSKPAQIKTSETTPAPVTETAALRMPPEPVEPEPNYSLQPEVESKTPVRPIKQKIRVRKSTAPLETTVSSTPVTTSKNPNNQQNPWEPYAAMGAGGLILAAWLLYRGRKKEEPPQQNP